jgi:hypothetical protein
MKLFTFYNFNIIDFFDRDCLLAFLKGLVCIIAKVVFYDDEVSFLPNGK